jgi:dTDP-4-amino-4,6-dideoxygalactose transaminase
MRRERAATYNRLLEPNRAIGVPHEPSWSRAVYHLYVIRAAQRDGLIDYLKAVGIGTGIHYPIALHLQSAYKSMGYNKGAFPVAEQVASEIISLPMFPHLAEKQQSHVAQEILNYTSRVFKAPAGSAI